MEYSLSVEQFNQSKMFDSNGKFFHKTGNRFKLFPFVTQPNSEPVLNLDTLVGRLLSAIEDKVPEPITLGELVDRLKESVEIEPGCEELFSNIIRQLFFDENGYLRPLNLKMLEQIPCTDSSERRVASYLVDVLGEKEVLAQKLYNAHKAAADNSNVLENLVLEKLTLKPVEHSKDIHYFRVINSLKNVFEEDFGYILENSQRSREYLVPLFEFYFFSYTAQVSMKLNQFVNGERSENIPLYFCFEWEKTSQSRRCYNEGWQYLQSAIEKIFAHAVALEILNQTESDSEQFDYIKLKELASVDEETDFKTAQKILAVTQRYRAAITDCTEMDEMITPDNSELTTATAIKFLFDSIKIQFENTDRSRAYSSYASKFEKYCKKYLKHRGRSGWMLNLSEETLIFLTKLCIKNEEQVRLKDVFEAMETRGIYLDDISKEHAAAYYEKLNLIEKKSDSGDAKYVKRIL